MSDRLALVSPPAMVRTSHDHDLERDPECRRALRWELSQDLAAIDRAIGLLELSEDLLAPELGAAVALAANLRARLVVLDALDAEARRAA